MAISASLKKSLEDYGNQLIRESRGYEDYWRTGVAGRQDFVKADEYNQQAIGRTERLAEALARGEKYNLQEDPGSLLRKYLGEGGSVNEQALNEYFASQDQILKQNQQLADFRDKAETQIFGGTGRALQDALADPNSELGGLGEFLKSQQSDIYQSNLRPLIEMQLGSKGLLDSGANVELQSKALGDLERGRQSRLMEAGLRAKEGIRGLERSDILGDIGSQQSALSNMFDLQRQGITMNFEMDLMNKRDQLARELASISNSGPSELQQIIGGIGGAASVGLAPFTGGASLAALPGFLGMFGGQGGNAGAGLSQLGMSFYNRGGGGSSYGSMPKYGGATPQAYYRNEFGY